MTIRQNWRSFHIPAHPLLDSGLRRNDGGVLFWLYVIPAGLRQTGLRITFFINLMDIEPRQAFNYCFAKYILICARP